MSSPKIRLLRNKRLAQSIHEVVTSSEFQAAADATLLQLIHDQQNTSDPTLAIAAYHQVRGAKLFLDKLQSIADQHKPAPKKAIQDNLEQNR